MVSCCHKAVKISLIGSSRRKDERIPHKSLLVSGLCAGEARRQQRRCKAASATPAAQKHETDVLVLGAGIIGLACAREMLRRDETIAVTVLDAGKGLFAGATGAGQGCGDFHRLYSSYSLPHLATVQAVTKGTAKSLCSKHSFPVRLGMLNQMVVVLQLKQQHLCPETQA